MNQWEYCQTINADGAHLDKYGADGWVLAGVAPDRDGDLVYTLMRPKAST